jgi:hypothetical protein
MVRQFMVEKLHEFLPIRARRLGRNRVWQKEAGTPKEE